MIFHLHLFQDVHLNNDEKPHWLALERCAVLRLGELTDLQTEQDDGRHCGNNDGGGGREALHDVVRVLHHNRGVQTPHTGQDWGL